MVNDLIADLLTRIRNGQRAGHRSVRVPSFKLGRAVLEVLKKEKFIESFEEKKDSSGKWSVCEVYLKYFGPHEPVISRVERVSRAGCRVYKGFKDLPVASRGLGISIVSTSQGVLSGREACRRKLGGEVIAIVA